MPGLDGPFLYSANPQVFAVFLPLSSLPHPFLGFVIYGSSFNTELLSCCPLRKKRKKKKDFSTWFIYLLSGDCYTLPPNYNSFIKEKAYLCSKSVFNELAKMNLNKLHGSNILVCAGRRKTPNLLGFWK